MMTSDQLRVKFLSFFQKKGHTIVPSASLIPRHDPTLLFTGAGMNQFKDQFMGRNITFTRAASCQKCLRTADLDNVGVTPGHHTFFEMLGNFSFGDYFKKEAIEWAWEFLTKEIKLPPDRLWVSVYEEDNEAYSIWKDVIGVQPERIAKFGDKDNFWPSEVKKNGPNGPCGPCSEIFYDWGESVGCRRKECNPSCDCQRFVEVWNLVFTQFDRKEDGRLEPLPMKNIDTGMGLERLAAVVQKKVSNFQIDTFLYIINAIKNELNLKYNAGEQDSAHINAIADHIRAVAFAIGDGVRPSNEGRGFVIRKLIRKTSQRARTLGVDEPFIYKTVPIVAKAMKTAYPELTRMREEIAEVILKEEISFREIVNTLLPHVDEELVGLKDKGIIKIPGEIIFKFYDEKGVPLDLIEERAKRYGISLDIEGFNRLLNIQKARSRDKSRVAGSIFFEKLSDINLKTEFRDTEVSTRSKVLGILVQKEKGLERANCAGIDETVHIALDTTPFYGESGGQAGDRGQLTKEDLKVEIYDTKRYEDTIVHIGRVTKGVVNVGDEVEAKIDTKRRERIKKNHTATHLLHSALRSILGSHVRQYGSLVEENRLRFDFTHPVKLQEGEVTQIEDMVNKYIKDDIPVITTAMDLEEAKKKGAIALFGEKYKNKVVVRIIGEVSKELCGGTHVARTGEIEVFKILTEGSVASGVRRIEALTGDAVYKWLREDIKGVISEYRNLIDTVKEILLVEDRVTIEKLDEYLKPVVSKAELIMRKNLYEFDSNDLKLWVKSLKQELKRAIEDLSKEFKKLKKKAKARRLNELARNIENFIKDAKIIGETHIILRQIEDADMEILRKLVDIIKSKLNSAFVLLGSKDSSKVNLICGLTEDLVKKGLDASALIKKIAETIDGSGGGRCDLAQAGGKSPSKLKEALENGLKIFQEVLS